MPRLRAVFTALGLCAALLAAGAPALASTRLLVGAANVDADSGELSVLVGAVPDDDRSLPITSAELLVDGQSVGKAATLETLSDWAAAQSDADPKWKPPLALGLVFLWTQSKPGSVAEGIRKYFKAIPGRTLVYPTVYGRQRHNVRRLSASEVADATDAEPEDDKQPNLADAIRTNLTELSGDTAPFKIMLVITDGRDFDDQGNGPGDVAGAGREVQEKGVRMALVAYPVHDDNQADQPLANDALSTLTQSARAFRRSVARDDLVNALARFGQRVGDLQRGRFKVPWSWRVLGGTSRVSLRVTAGGQTLTEEVGRVTLPPQKGWLVGGGFAVVILVVGGAWAFKRKAQAGGSGGGASDDDGDELLETLHDIVRRGMSPERAASELQRNFPRSVGKLAKLSEDALDGPQFPYFRTRAGRLRLKQIQAALAEHVREDGSGLDDTIAEVVAAAVGQGLAPEAAATRISARATQDAVAAFMCLKRDELGEALASAAEQHAALRKPRARGVATQIQEALQKQSEGEAPVTVGWLVRAAGPGRRGETLRLSGGRVMVGSGAGCQIRLEDLAPQHAEIVESRGEFSIAVKGGQVKVEGAPVSGKRPLVDGETIELGRGRFIFKCASGTVLRRSKARTSTGRSSRVSRSA